MNSRSDTPTARRGGVVAAVTGVDEGGERAGALTGKMASGGAGEFPPQAARPKSNRKVEPSRKNLACDGGFA
jgi:hypothetical protein